LDAIMSLREIARRLTADTDQPRLTREINELLRDRGRAGFVKGLFADGFVNALLGDLLEIGRRLRGQESWSDVAQSFGVSAGPGSMAALCDARIERALVARGYDVDDRYVERGSAAFREFLAASVGGDLITATQGDAEEIDVAIRRDMFANTVGGFLGDLITQTVGSESYLDLGAAAPAVERAADTVAIAIYDRFAEQFVKTGKAEPREALRIISDNYPMLVARQ
jgi:hypothetical protein